MVYSLPFNTIIRCIQTGVAGELESDFVRQVKVT